MNKRSPIIKAAALLLDHSGWIRIISGRIRIRIRCNNFHFIEAFRNLGTPFNSGTIEFNHRSASYLIEHFKLSDFIRRRMQIKFLKEFMKNPSRELAEKINNFKPAPMPSMIDIIMLLSAEPPKTQLEPITEPPFSRTYDSIPHFYPPP